MADRASVSLGLIWAQARGGVIGRDGVLPWHLPEDLAHFKTVTAGATVIMGRRTWESLPTRFRPLPGRRNIVLTRQNEWRADGAVPVATVAEALALGAEASTVGTSVTRTWIIGGAEVFRATMAHADRLEITQIDADVSGDTFAPSVTAEWRALERDSEWRISADGISYRFLSYAR